MTEQITLSLKKLAAWDGNVRKTGADDGLDELAASIAAHGVLQSLIVRKASRGKYAVVAGRRRLLALKALAGEGRIADDMAVPCIIMDEAANATEVSLAENVIRLPMHPADQFEAFRELIEQGGSVSEIASRFGVSEDLIAKRLKLGRLSAAILDAFRVDEIGLEEAMAFTLSDDPAEQERVFAELTGYARNARNIRAALTHGEVPLTDRRVRFVGLEAYEDAGGAVRRDLFDDRTSGYLQDESLLARLVAEKLKAAADEVKVEGWKFVDVLPEDDYAVLSAYDRRRPDRAPLSKKAERQIAKLNREYEKLADTGDADETDEATSERLAEIETEIDALNDTADVWSPEALASAGAVITLDYNGKLDIRRGMIRPEDARAAKAVARKAAVQARGIDPARILPSKLVADLTANKTAAMRAELAKQPGIALAAIVHALALGAFYPSAMELSCLQLDAQTRPLAKLMSDGDGCKALGAMEAKRSNIGALLPDSPDALWSWCLAQSRETLLDVLAFACALSIDAVAFKDDAAASSSVAHGEDLARALHLDMNGWYTPTAANFFGRVSRKAIIAALGEAKGAPQGPALDKMKKADLAERAERVIDGTGWLPALLRVETSPADQDDGPVREAAE